MKQNKPLSDYHSDFRLKYYILYELKRLVMDRNKPNSTVSDQTMNRLYRKKGGRKILQEFV